ncbi:MAG: GGDEF domain-containing protein [Lachnospiraceae bacterium]|nr:GGDEF domain-containing protein [Lachnospiraceae bacterium]
MFEDKKIAALCTSRIYDPKIHTFIEQLNEKLIRVNCRLFIYAINSDLYWGEENISETSVFDAIDYDVTDVVIIMDEKIKSRRISEMLIERASARSIPVVVVDGDYENTTMIRFDYAKGFEGIVRHVIEDHGVKEPHFMAGIKDNPFSEERLLVFRKVLEENGIPFREDMVSYGEFWATPARQAASELLKRGHLPEAVICANDIMALNVLDVFKNAGILVPDDIMITGFDGYDEVFLSSPAIATVSCRTPELSDATAEAVIKCFCGKAGGIYPVLPRMVPNESCGCPRCTDNSYDALKLFNMKFYRYQDDIRRQHITAATMHTSPALKELVFNMRQYYMPHTICILNRDCFRTDRNYFLSKEHPDEYLLLYDSEFPDNEPVPFSKADIGPYFREHLNTGYPLIFNSLDYMNEPMGFVCYSFPSYDLTEYSKTAGISNMISEGIGGYINILYQQFLLQKVEDMYKLDSLTGLYNRLAFRGAFDALKNAPENNGVPLSVIMADLDRLKKINDSLGHDKGDKAIASVAEALKKCCPEDSLFVRFGGDEMLAFVPGPADCSGIISNMEAFLEERSRSLGYRIAASCGSYTTVLSPDTNVEELVKHVDEQMYIIKEEHRKKQ